MEYVCIQAHGDHEAGHVVEIPDGAAVSPVHFAAPGSPEAAAAQAGRGTVSHFEHPAGQPVESPVPVPEIPGGGEDASPPPGPGTIPVPGSMPLPSSPGFSAPADKETSE